MGNKRACFLLFSCSIFFLLKKRLFPETLLFFQSISQKSYSLELGKRYFDFIILIFTKSDFFFLVYIYIYMYVCFYICSANDISLSIEYKILCVSKVDNVYLMYFINIYELWFFISFQELLILPLRLFLQRTPSFASDPSQSYSQPSCFIRLCKYVLRKTI